MGNKTIFLKIVLSILFPVVPLLPQTSVARTCPVNITDALVNGPEPNVAPPAPQGTPE